MKSLSVMFVISVLFAVQVLAQAPDTVWTKTYGASGEDWAWSVRETADSGYVIVGSSSSFASYGYDVYLIKTDVDGDTAWTRTYGGEDTDRGYSVEQTSDGGYIIAGYTRSFGVSDADVYLVKTDENGDTLWTKTYSGLGYEEARSVQQTDDDGYIVAGYTGPSGAGATDVYLIKTDSLGGLIWARTYGGYYNDVGLCVKQTADGGYIVAGQLGTIIAGFQAYLIKTNSLGQTMWDREYGYPDINECGYSVEEVSDNGFIIAGYSGDSADYDIYLVKTDSSGIKQWDRWIGGNSDEFGYEVQQTNDGGYIIVGVTFSFGASWGNVYLVRTNDNGNTIWQETYGGTDTEYGRSVRKTWDNGYILAGHTYSFGAGSRDVYLIKLAPDTLGIKDHDVKVLHGNDFVPTIISGPLILRDGKRSIVYDITGRVVAPERMIPGVYFIQIDGKIKQKIIKIR